MASIAQVSPCAQQPRPCTGPGDCAACGNGWSCQNGRCAAAAQPTQQEYLRAKQQAMQGRPGLPPNQQPQPTQPPTLQQVNPPQLPGPQRQQAERQVGGAAGADGCDRAIGTRVVHGQSYATVTNKSSCGANCAGAGKCCVAPPGTFTTCINTPTTLYTGVPPRPPGGGCSDDGHCTPSNTACAAGEEPYCPPGSGTRTCACRATATTPCTQANVATACASHSCPAAGQASTWTEKYCNNAGQCACQEPQTEPEPCADGSTTTGCPACDDGQDPICTNNACACPDPVVTPCQGGADESGCPDCTTAPNTEKYCNGTTCGCRRPVSGGRYCTGQSDPCSDHTCPQGQVPYCNNFACDCKVGEAAPTECSDGETTTGCASCGAGQSVTCNGTTCGCTPDTETGGECRGSDVSGCSISCTGATPELWCDNGTCACRAATVGPQCGEPIRRLCVDGKGGIWTNPGGGAACTCTDEKCATPCTNTGQTCDRATGQCTSDTPAPGTTDCDQTRTACTSASDCDQCAPVRGQQGQWLCQTEGIGQRCVWRRGQGGDCTSDANCGDGKCHPTTRKCVECLADGDCAGDVSCENAMCGGDDDPPPGTPCETAEQCVETHGEGATCEEGQCRAAPSTPPEVLPVPEGVTPCEDNRNCPTGQVCVRGRCQDPGAGPAPPTTTGLTPQVQAPPEPTTIPTLQTPDVYTPRPPETPAAPGDPGALPTFSGDPNVDRPSFPTDPGTGEALPDPTIEITMAQLRETPGYKFRLAEGSRALAAQMNSAGMLASGDAMKAFTRYAQDYASGEYEKAYKRKVDEYNRKTAKNKEELKRKADRYNREFQSALQEYGMNAQDFQRALQAQTAARADVVAKYGMTMQQFNAAMQKHGADRQRELDKYGISVDAFNRMLAEHATLRADALAKYGMDQQKFTAMLNGIRAKLQISEAEWGRWLSRFAIEQGNLRGILGLA